MTQPNQWEVRGLESDKMSVAATEFHIQHVLGEMQRQLGDLVGSGLRHVLFDSYEAGTPSWTPLMPAEFATRRGYSLLPFLATFAGRVVGSEAETNRFRTDFDRTIADLYRDVHFATVSRLLHGAGLEYACEPYGGPFDTGEVAPFVDRVMTEFWTAGGAFSGGVVRCVFALSGRQPELWDPVTGERRGLADSASADGETALTLAFAPTQSWFVVFRRPATAPASGGRNYPLRTSLLGLTGAWTVTFDPRWGGPEQPSAFPTLTDWTRRPEPGIRCYSDTATNRLIGDEQEPPDCDWQPGHMGGSYLKRFPDWFVRQEPRPSQGRYGFTTWNYFSKDSPLVPSGLLGPVQVLAEDWAHPGVTWPEGAFRSYTADSLETDVLHAGLARIATVADDGVAHPGGSTTADALINGTTRNGAGGDGTLDDGKTFRGYGDGSLTVHLDGAHDLTAIRSFAGHHDARASQDYTVLLAHAHAPEAFVELTAATVPCAGGASELRLKSAAAGVVAVRFEFRNGPLGFNVYREIQIVGRPTSPVDVRR